MVPNDQNPLVHELDKLERLARDIAEGTLAKKWTPYFEVGEPDGRGIIADDGLWNGLKELKDEHNNRKWTDDDIDYYSVPLLASLGYLERRSHGHRRDVRKYGTLSIDYFQITQKAFDLLSKPAEPPSVFISYKRSESSAFALYIEARLKLVGIQNPFIDKDIHIGDEFEPLIRERIREAKYFVCLITEQTLNDSNGWVRKELNWAQDAECIIMAVCHNGLNESKVTGQWTELEGKHIRRVQVENALNYETEANAILSRMGYRTN